MTAGAHVTLAREEWIDRIKAHEERARVWVDPHLDRRSRGEKHPIWDFIFDYYAVRPSHVMRWHPGMDVVLASAGDAPHAQWRDYRIDSRGNVSADVSSFLSHRKRDMENLLDILTSTQLNRTHFDCFGLHEWAMVYRQVETRHPLPLRLGPEGTNDVVESHELKCTHYDAFRFFTPPAKPLNLTVLDSTSRPSHEQAGCLHAGMDLFKWAAKMGPLVPGDLLLDCFELAIDIRLLDMEASPYDCSVLGYGIVPIETAEGKAEYVARQRAFTARAEPLRHRLVAILTEVLDD